MDARPSLLCGHLRVSDSGAAWSEVWATIPASEPLELVLYLQGGSQVCPPARPWGRTGGMFRFPQPTGAWATLPGTNPAQAHVILGPQFPWLLWVTPLLPAGGKE